MFGSNYLKSILMIVGITGRAGSGKDTVASIAQELYPELNWQIKGFADKLRQVASLLTGIPADEMKKQEVKERFLPSEWNDRITNRNGNTYGVSMTVRDLLQRLGTDAVRDKLHPNSWVNALMCDYQEIVFNHKWHRGEYWNKCLKCKDMFIGHKLQRFCQPCRQVEYRSWPNWLITDCRFPNELEAITSRGGICVRIVRPDNPYPKSNHESETALDGVELLTIINDGNIDQLRIKVKEILDPIIDRLCAGSAG